MQDAHSAAMRLISIKRRTKKEAFDLLVKKGYSEEEALEAAEYYSENGYIDDRDYARRYALDAYNIGGKGPKRIERELLEKGVANEDIYAALSNIEFDLTAQMQKKFANADISDLKQKQKIINHFLYKGFDTGAIFKSMDTLFGDDFNE